MRGLQHWRRPVPTFAVPGRKQGETNGAQLLVLGGALLGGLVCGSMWQPLAQSKGRTYLFYFAQQYLHRYETGQFWPVFTAGYLTAVLLLGITVFFGLSCVGVPIVLGVPFGKGFTTGCVSAYLYTQLGLRGMAANLLLFFVPEVIKMCSLLAVSQASLDTTIGLFRLNFCQQALGAGAKIARCLRTFVFSALLTLAAVLLEAAAAAILGPVFFKL